MWTGGCRRVMKRGDEDVKRMLHEEWEEKGTEFCWYSLYDTHTLSGTPLYSLSQSYNTEHTERTERTERTEDIDHTDHTHHTHHTHRTPRTPPHTRTCMPAPGNDFIKFAPYPANIPARPSFTTICVIQSIVPV
jgi:hypothetical protein